MIEWNIRVNWRGKLILRRFIAWVDDGREVDEWRDATPEDLRDYFDFLNGAIK